jgi:hypothetical protein
MNPSQQEKELLIAESELNRALLREDWCTITKGVRHLSAGLQSVGSLASMAALLVTAISSFRRERAAATGAKASWIDTALKGAKLASSIWMAFRSKP